MKRTLTFLFFLMAFSQILLSQKIYPAAPSQAVRTMAEWEEEQAIAIAWSSSFSNQFPILTNIVKNAMKEVVVIIVCNSKTDSTSARNYLQNNGVILNNNVVLIVKSVNTIWIRDYGPNTVYYNDVDSLAFVDWRYNRPRPADDIVSDALGKMLKKSIFKTISGNEDLVNTGGNFMADGLGTAFASKLILNENVGKPVGNSPFATKKSEAKIDSIMQEYMGISRYIKMETLPNDGIHHIDMHMKLLDEETLLVGKYPDGISDGPQIEANLQYVLSNFKTPYGKKYDIVRIPMPPDENGKYPNVGAPSLNGKYRTYANAIFVNKTVLVPTYEQKYDTTAIKIWQKALPGHTIVGINCNSIIGQSGAIHCITKEIGVDEPLLITHSKIREYVIGDPNNPISGFIVYKAAIKHKNGIKNATIKYRNQNHLAWTSLAMEKGNGDEWFVNLSDKKINRDTIYYFIEAEANNGKKITRPITGENGAWRFPVLISISSTTNVENSNIEIAKIYPNPASAITCVELNSEVNSKAKVELFDINGRLVNSLYNGAIDAGVNRFFFDASLLASGVYVVQVAAGNQRKTSRVVVK